MNDLLIAVERLAESWGERLLDASWEGAVVLAVACAIVRWCPFLSPRVSCWVLRLACLKLVVALFWVEPICLPLLPATPARSVSRETLVIPPTDLIISSSDTQPASEEQRTIEAFGFAGQSGPQPRAAINRIGKLPLLQAVWLAGFCSCVLITLGHWITIRKLCRAADPMLSVGLQQSLRREAQRLSIRLLPMLRISRQAEGPLLAGFRCPTIILPSRIEESFDESEVRMMLAHELAHLKGCDLQWNWLPTIVGWLFWFHPLVWLMKRVWCEAQEAACDEILIQNSVARPVEYSRLLLKLAAGWQRQSSAGLIAVRMFGSYHDLNRRILTMTRVRAFSLSRTVMAATILSLVAVPLTIPWRLVAQEPDRGVQPAVDSATDSAPAKQEAAATEPIRSETQEPKFKEAADRGMAAFRKRDYAQAFASFDEAVRIDPDHSEARRWRGDALMNQGEFDKALSAYEDALRIDPKNAMAYFCRGIASIQKRELGPALIALGTAVELDPKLASRPDFKRRITATQSLLSPNCSAFGHPEKEKSPFSAVRWQGSDPEVKVGEEWFKLVSLNEIPVVEIVTFSRQRFGSQWKMRIEEDLVELLTRMGHPPKDTAELIVQSLTSSETRTLKDVPMTAANRWTIKRENNRTFDASVKSGGGLSAILFQFLEAEGLLPEDK